MNDTNPRPRSSVPPLTGYLGIVAIITLFFLWPEEQIFSSSLEDGVLFLLFVFAVMAAYELIFAKTYKAPESGLDFSQQDSLRIRFGKNFAIKIFGLLMSLLLVSLYFWIADMYSNDWYQRFFKFIFKYAWIIGSLVIAYFCLIHAVMKEPNDAYWNFGKFILSRGKEADKALIRDHVLGLAIKAFFLPLMFCYFMDDWFYLTNFNWDTVQTFEDFFPVCYRFLYFIDLAFVVMGYVFTARLFNAHIRWPERRLAGWFVCLLCYMPFWQLIGREFLRYYDGEYKWGQWLFGYDTLSMVLGSLILLLSAIYIISEAHFGLRFSNLTYRGLISHGMYRFTKHPAYISKNLSWWMIDIPFIALDWTLAVRNSLTLLVLNFVYYMRAKYEESCLSPAPEYRDYMAYIEQKGIFSRRPFKSPGKVENAL